MAERETNDSLKISTPEMDRKLTDLEERAIALESQLDSILKKTSEIELWVKQYESKVKEEKRMIGLLHTLVRPGDKRATLLMNHVSVFFDEVLTRLENKGLKFNHLKFLHRDLCKDDVGSSLETVLNEMGFSGTEISDVKLIITLMHSRVKRKSQFIGANGTQGLDNDPSFVQQEMKIFLQVRDELDEQMRNTLKKIILRCYRDREEAIGDQNNNELDH